MQILENGVLSTGKDAGLHGPDSRASGTSTTQKVNIEIKGGKATKEDALLHTAMIQIIEQLICW